MQSAYAVKYGSTVLAGLTQLDAQTNPEVSAEVGIGSQYPQFAVVRSIKPRLAFQTRAIAPNLTVTGASGAPLSDINKVIASFVELDEGSPTSVTLDYTFDRGLLLPRRLSAQHGADAVLDMECLSYSSDGAAAPLTIATGTAPTLAQDNVRHTLKSASVAGIDLDCVTDLSIDFGVNANTLGCNSDLYDKHIAKEGGITPRVTINTLANSQLQSLTLKGKYGSHANTVIRLRQYDNADIGFEASLDVVLTLHGHVSVRSHSGNGQTPATEAIEIVGAWDGTNAPMTVTIETGV